MFHRFKYVMATIRSRIEGITKLTVIMPITVPASITEGITLLERYASAAENAGPIGRTDGRTSYALKFAEAVATELFFLRRRFFTSAVLSEHLSQRIKEVGALSPAVERELVARYVKAQKLARAEGPQDEIAEEFLRLSEAIERWELSSPEERVKLVMTPAPPRRHKKPRNYVPKRARTEAVSSPKKEKGERKGGKKGGSRQAVAMTA